MWIGILSLVLWCFLAIVLSLSLPRNKALFLVLLQKLSIVLWLQLQLNCIGLGRFFAIIVFSFLTLLFSSVIMSVLWPLHPILCFMLRPNTLRLIITLFMKRSSSVICWLNSSLRMINLLICLPMVFLLQGLIGLLPNSCGNFPFV